MENEWFFREPYEHDRQPSPLNLGNGNLSPDSSNVEKKALLGNENTSNLIIGPTMVNTNDNEENGENESTSAEGLFDYKPKGTDKNGKQHISLGQIQRVRSSTVS